MSVSRGFGLNGKSLYTNVVKPEEVWLNFIVDSTNSNGFGTRSLKSNGYVESVFMYTNPQAITASSVFGSGVTTITLNTVANLFRGMAVTDSTTGGNIQANTTITSINVAANQITLSLATGGASASSPGDTLSFVSTSAATGNYITVAGGNCLVTFKNNFNYYLGGPWGQIVPVTSPTTTSLTAGHTYVITVLGTTTTAQWQTAGLPAGFTPAVGAAFVAAATASLGGTGKVGLPGVPTATQLVVVGDPNKTIANSSISTNAGAKILLQFSAATNSSTTTLVSAAPADGTVVGMQFCFDASSVTIDGI